MTAVLARPDDIQLNKEGHRPLDAVPLPDRRRLGWAALEIVVGVVFAFVLSLALQWLIARLHVARPTYAPNAAIAVVVSALVVVALAMVWRSFARGRWPVACTALGHALLAALPTATLSFMLLGTRLYLGGISSDNQFRTEYLTRFASSPALADFTYRGVAPFYPAAWFWLGGRFADLTGEPGWAVLKPWSIATLAVVSVVVFALWSLVLRRGVALLLALLTVAMCLLQGASEPYSWVIIATIAPIAVLAWRMLRDLAALSHPRGWAVVVTIGVALGLYGVCYTLYLGYFALLLVVLAVVAVVAGRRADAPPPVSLVLGRLGLRALLAVGIAVAIMLLVWMPYLGSVLAGSSGGNAAAHFLPEDSASVPTPMLEVSVLGALCLAGTVWIVLRARRDPIAQAMGAVVLVGYLWFFLNFLAVALDTTLLAFRLLPMLDLTLACAGLLGALDALVWLRRNHLSRRGFELRSLGGIAGFLVLLFLVQSAPGLATADDAAFADYYPTGTNASGAADPSSPDYWVPRLNATIAALSGRQPQQLVVLTDQNLLTVTSPYWRFQALTKHYADPLGQFDARNAEIEQWAKAGGPSQLLSELDSSRFASPSVFVFEATSAGWSIVLSKDVFPQQPNVLGYTVAFPPSLFATPAFSVRAVGPYVVVVRNSNA
ncbi:MAG TPA: arabinofuranosyltransferase [Pseudonocardiaceae bacterium]|jgi:galactan 5-O-arabinofuranosyltransferase|nr:arabinofuranosyltransferase [Pseudonocardiaceae bacterium]